LKHRVGSYVVEPKDVEDHEFTEEPGAFHGQAMLDVGGEEDKLVVEGSQTLLFSRSVPYSFFLIGKEASTSESSQILDGDAGSLPVGGDLV
jgi:hypothetical protein